MPNLLESELINIRDGQQLESISSIMILLDSEKSPIWNLWNISKKQSVLIMLIELITKFTSIKLTSLIPLHHALLMNCALLDYNFAKEKRSMN